MRDHSFGEPDQNAPEPPQPTLLARPRAVPLVGISLLMRGASWPPMPRRAQFAKVVRQRQTRGCLMGPNTYLTRGARSSRAQNPSFPRLSDTSSTSSYTSSDFSPTLSWPAGSFAFEPAPAIQAKVLRAQRALMCERRKECTPSPARETSGRWSAVLSPNRGAGSGRGRLLPCQRPRRAGGLSGFGECLPKRK